MPRALMMLLPPFGSVVPLASTVRATSIARAPRDLCRAALDEAVRQRRHQRLDATQHAEPSEAGRHDGGRLDAGDEPGGTLCGVQARLSMRREVSPTLDHIRCLVRRAVASFGQRDYQRRAGLRRQRFEKR